MNAETQKKVRELLDYYRDAPLTMTPTNAEQALAWETLDQAITRCARTTGGAAAADITAMLAAAKKVRSLWPKEKLSQESSLGTLLQIVELITKR